MCNNNITRFQSAKEQYAKYNVDVEQAVKCMEDYPISLHCWQGDDVTGFESGHGDSGNDGIIATGAYPGKARNIEELQEDLVFAYSFLGGKRRLNLHAMYGDSLKTGERDSISPDNFKQWLAWGQEHNVLFDFNATCFSDPLVKNGLTLSSPDHNIRTYWINHVKQARAITAWFGKQQHSPALHNLWIPDGFKEYPAEAGYYRELLIDSLDKIYSQKYEKNLCLDSVESKLFGIGAESYTTGSHEFYYGYACKNDLHVCLDMGHFHPTESVADKISAMLPFLPGIALHISRGVRWDSDHVTLLNDSLYEMAKQITRIKDGKNIRIGLDFFDASINRIAAWTMGYRAMLKALLFALCCPFSREKDSHRIGDFTKYMLLRERAKTLPFSDIWDYYCESVQIPDEDKMIRDIEAYGKKVLQQRS